MRQRTGNKSVGWGWSGVLVLALAWSASQGCKKDAPAEDEGAVSEDPSPSATPSKVDEPPSKTDETPPPPAEVGERKLVEVESAGAGEPEPGVPPDAAVPNAPGERGSALVPMSAQERRDRAEARRVEVEARRQEALAKRAEKLGTGAPDAPGSPSIAEGMPTVPAEGMPTVPAEPPGLAPTGRLPMPAVGVGAEPTALPAQPALPSLPIVNAEEVGGHVPPAEAPAAALPPAVEADPRMQAAHTDATQPLPVPGRPTLPSRTREDVAATQRGVTTWAGAPRTNGPALDISTAATKPELEQLSGQKLKLGKLSGIEPGPGYNSLLFETRDGKFAAAVQVWAESTIKDTRTRYDQMKITYPNVRDTTNITPYTFFSSWNNLYTIAFMDLKRRRIVSVSCASDVFRPHQLYQLAKQVQERTMQ